MRRLEMMLLGAMVLACGPGPGPGGDGTGTGSPGSDEGSTVDLADDASGSESGLPVTTSGESTGAPSCGGLCLEPPSNRWRGPVAIATVEDPGEIECGGEYPMRIATFGHMIINADEPCECNCTPPFPSDCSLTASVHPDDACGDAPAPVTVETGCGLVDGGSVMIDAPTHAEVCDPFADPPTSDFDFHTVLCEGAPSGSCEGDQQCVTTPGATLDGPVCWWAPGIEDCPPGLPEQLIVYSATDDQRTCADEGCECSGAPVCTGGVIVHDSCDMEPPDRPPLLPGECLPLAGLTGVSPDFAIDGGCTATVRTVPVIGTLTEDAPQTLCCTQP